MSTVRKAETRLDDALDRLERDGGPVPVARGGRTVGVLLTLRELEALEDRHDARVLRDALARGRTDEAVSLDSMAADLGVELPGRA